MVGALQHIHGMLENRTSVLMVSNRGYIITWLAVKEEPDVKADHHAGLVSWSSDEHFHCIA